MASNTSMDQVPSTRAAYRWRRETVIGRSPDLS